MGLNKIFRLLEELKSYLENARILIIVSLAAVIITAVTNFIFRKYRVVKYLPGLIFIILGFFNLMQIGSDFTSAESLDSFLLFLVLFIGGLIGLFTALIIGIYNKPKKIKKIRNTEEE